jgi:hypothetical protein
MALESLLILISNWPWILLDVTSIRDASQTMDRRSCQYDFMYPITSLAKTDLA